MSGGKFSVIAARRVLRNAVKSRARNIATEIPRHEKRIDAEEKLKERLTPGKSSKRCEQIYAESEEKKFFSGPQPTCEAQVESVDYQRAHQTLKLKSENLQKYIDSELRSILEHVENELRNSNTDYCMGLIRGSTDTGLKLRELTHLDASCGSLKRKELLAAVDQTRRTFRRLQCDAIPSVEKIRTMLERIREEAAACAAHASDSLLSCRDCNTPQALASCVQKQTSTAEKVLDEAAAKAAEKLRTVKSLRDKIIRRHKTAMDEVIVVYRAKMIGLARQLQKSIDSIRNWED